jgi:hypothetical protein
VRSGWEPGAQGWGNNAYLAERAREAAGVCVGALRVGCWSGAPLNEWPWDAENAGRRDRSKGGEERWSCTWADVCCRSGETRRDWSGEREREHKRDGVRAASERVKAGARRSLRPRRGNCGMDG